VAKSKLSINKADVLAARTIAITPTSFAAGALAPQLTEEQRHVIANAVDRSLCIGVSDRFVVVPRGERADLTVHVTLTHITLTDIIAAGASKAAAVVPMFVSTGTPIFVPRIPYGMGSLSAEAEAKDHDGKQKAAFVWARGADMLTSNARVAADGDAYDLAKELGADLSKFLNTGESPFRADLSMPSSQKVQSSFGGKPKYAACDAFGRAGVGAFLGGKLGAPPEWNDDAKPEASGN
jgi:hypothetical protein